MRKKFLAFSLALTMALSAGIHMPQVFASETQSDNETTDVITDIPESTDESETPTIPDVPDPTEPEPTGWHESQYVLSISSLPEKVNYMEGEELDLTGLTVNLELYDQHGEHHNTFLDVSPFDHPEAFIVDISDFDSKVGKYTITISCTGIYEAAFLLTAPVSFEVYVNPKLMPYPPVSDSQDPWGLINIKNCPDKRNYALNEDVDLTGLKVNLDYSYNDKDGQRVTKSIFPYDVSPFDYPDVFEVDTSYFDSSKAGYYMIKIRCTSKIADTYRVFLNEDAFMVTVLSGVPGDVNNDGKVDATDVKFLQMYLTGSMLLSYMGKDNADLNNDGVVNVFDLCALRKKVLTNVETEKNIDYSVLEENWVRDNSSRKQTMTDQIYLAKSLDEFKSIIENYELCEYSSECSCKYHDVENCIPEGIDEKFFEDNAVVVIYSSHGAGNRIIDVNKIVREQNSLNVYTTITNPIATPDMAYERIILTVARKDVQDTNNILRTNNVYIL